MIRVMVVGDVRLYRDGLAASLRGYEEFAVVGVARCDPLVLDSLKANPPDILLLDVRGFNSLELAQQVRRELPSTRVIAFAVEEREPEIVTFARAGVAGYVSADASVEDLVGSIRGAVAEELVCSPKISSALLRGLASRADAIPAPMDYGTLTARERQVLRLICEGLSNKEIAHACHISEATVKNHVHHLLEKLRATNRSQAAARAALVVWPARD